MDWNQITAIATAVMAIGVVLVFWQIRLTKKQAVTQFEDGMAGEYRDLIQRIPTKALLGEELGEDECQNALDEFYHYIDLSNEQVFLRMNNRITFKTWQNWCDGIKANLSRPAFKKAWTEIKSRATESFNELRRLENSGFKDDPSKWR